MNIFERNVPGTTEIFQQKIIGIAGCGGLGSNAAVSLVRAGVGHLILADFDRVEPSNLNRQYFFREHIGQFKTEALASILKSINPDVKLDILTVELKREDVSQFFAKADLLIEAFDKAENKAWLIEEWCSNYPEKPIICASGIAGIGKTESLKIFKTANIYIVGDAVSDMSLGLCSARVAIVANMQANLALEILSTQITEI